MTNILKKFFLSELTRRAGMIHKISDSLSMYTVEGSGLRFYIRYSKTHAGNRTWYDLRDTDLQQLEGHPSYLCFLWDGQVEPLLIPYSEYEDVFQSTTPAEDGQYKVQILLQEDGTELYLARVGRFNVDGFFGWNQIDKFIDTSGKEKVPELTHSQVQTLLGSIGVVKNFDVWIPTIDRSKLDWTITYLFNCREYLPYGFEQIENILNEVDVIWLKRGSNELQALFEVEHSTPVYPGLLRFNDVHLVAPNLRPRFSIVANSERRSLFVRQINRPTFRSSGLNELCTFFEYADVSNWHQRVIMEKNQ